MNIQTNSLKKTALIACGVLMASMLSTGGAQAGNPAQCAAYANQAVLQQSRNLQNSCGFTGPRWGSNFGIHLTWCLGAPTSAINAERNARVNMLASCTGSGGGGGGGGVTYNKPKIGGLRLDWCRVWANECGQPAANAFCQSEGHANATSFSKASNIGAFAKTLVIGSGQVCDQPDCDGFAWIKCSN